MRLEIRRCAYDRWALVRREADSDHVLLDVFAEVDARVETVRYDVTSTIIRGHIEHYIRVLAVQQPELGRKNRGYSQARDQEARRASSPV